MLQNFWRVPVRKKIVGFEILVYLDELQIATQFLPRPAGARFAIANHAAPCRDPTGIGQRAQRQNHAGRVAPGVGDDARMLYLRFVNLRHSISRFAQ